jgi:hypothetical protein
MVRLLEDGDELALPWDDLADGRAWQLVRGRDFFRNPREVEEAARSAAVRLGKAVQTVRSLHASVSSIWVQFADDRIEPGAPCPCGSDDLRRVNDGYAICASCESRLLVETKQKGSGGGAADGSHAGDDSDGTARLRIFVPEGGRIGDERKRLAALRRAPKDGETLSNPKPAAEKKEVQARERAEQTARIRECRDTIREQRRETRKGFGTQKRLRRVAEHDARTRPNRVTRGTTTPPGPQQETLDHFANVRLWAREKGRPGRYWGFGYDRKGRFVLLELTLQLSPNRVPVEDPARPGRALHFVSAVRTAPYSSAVDADALLARPDGLSPDVVLGLGPR